MLGPWAEAWGPWRVGYARGPGQKPSQDTSRNAAQEGCAIFCVSWPCGSVQCNGGQTLARCTAMVDAAAVEAGRSIEAFMWCGEMEPPLVRMGQGTWAMAHGPSGLGHGKWAMDHGPWAAGGRGRGCERVS